MTRVASGQTLGDREAQEDAVQIIHQSDADADGDVLLLLADGMGGHAGGEVASNLAIATFADHFQNVSKNMRPLGRLEESLVAANAAISDRVTREPDLHGMGCTFLAVLVAAGRVIWCSVGDSVLFLLRNGQLKRLNADHSFFGELREMVGRGELTLAEAEAHPRKNALRSAMMGKDLNLIDLQVIEAAPNDMLILASDGLETLSYEEIARIAYDNSKAGPDAVTLALLDAVADRARPKQDNTSIIVLRGAGNPTATMQADSKWTFKENGSNKILPMAISGAAIAGFALLALLLLNNNDPVPTTPSDPAFTPAIVENRSPAPILEDRTFDGNIIENESSDIPPEPDPDPLNDTAPEGEEPPTPSMRPQVRPDTLNSDQFGQTLPEREID